MLGRLEYGGKGSKRKDINCYLKVLKALDGNSCVVFCRSLFDVARATRKQLHNLSSGTARKPAPQPRSKVPETIYFEEDKEAVYSWFLALTIDVLVHHSISHNGGEGGDLAATQAHRSANLLKRLHGGYPSSHARPIL